MPIRRIMRIQKVSGNVEHLPVRADNEVSRLDTQRRNEVPPQLRAVLQTLICIYAIDRTAGTPHH